MEVAGDYNTIMSDIFISYARDDRERAGAIAGALEAQGWTVWWDPHIPPGKTFSEVIDEELAACKCVVALWSKVSTRKNWVLEEAEDGLKRGILVPVLIDDVTPPRGFRRIQGADLIGWTGDVEAEGFAAIVDRITEIVGRTAASAEAEPADELKEEAAIPEPGKIQSERRTTPAKEQTPIESSANRGRAETPTAESQASITAEAEPTVADLQPPDYSSQSGDAAWRRAIRFFFPVAEWRELRALKKDRWRQMRREPSFRQFGLLIFGNKNSRKLSFSVFIRLWLGMMIVLLGLSLLLTLTQGIA